MVSAHIIFPYKSYSTNIPSKYVPTLSIITFPTKPPLYAPPVIILPSFVVTTELNDE